MKDLISVEEMEKLYRNHGNDTMMVNENAEYNVGETSNRANTSSGDERIQTRENRKRKEDEGSSSEPLNDGEDESNVPKKKRFIWTSDMHRKFVDVIAQIGEDKAFPKKIVEVMNEPGLTRENVASHLQKYRICLKKAKEERDKTPYMCNSSLKNHQHPYLGISQLASNNSLPLSTSIHSSIYRTRAGIGASSCRLAPPSYWCFDVSSLPAVNTGNAHNQHSLRIKANKSIREYGNEERNILLMSTLDKRPSSSTPDDHATSSSTSNSAFLGLRIADDGKSLLYGGSNRSDIVPTGGSLRMSNDFHHQVSAAPITRNFNIENYAEYPLLPPLPDYIDHLEEPSLPPLPEFCVENSLPQLETQENEFINFIPQQETYLGTSLAEDINSLSSRQIGTSLDQLNSLQSLASEILENIEREKNTQIFTNNHIVTSLPPTAYSWNPTTNMEYSHHLIIQEDSLPPLPSEVPWDLSPDSTTPDLIPSFMDQHNSPLPPLPSESEWNVISNASTMPVSNNHILDQEHLHSGSPPEIPWNLDLGPVPQPSTGNFFEEQNAVSDQMLEAAFGNLSSFHAN